MNKSIFLFSSTILLSLSGFCQEEPPLLFQWDISHAEHPNDYGYYSLVKFTYAGKQYTMDTLFSRVHGCDPNEEDPSMGCDFEGTNVIAAYFGADASVFCKGQIMDNGDSLSYWQHNSVEEDGGSTPIESITTFLK